MSKRFDERDLTRRQFGIGSLAVAGIVVAPGAAADDILEQSALIRKAPRAAG